MGRSTLRYALMVFLAGATYGMAGSLAKFAYSDGWTWREVSFGQGFFAMLIFGVLCLLFMARGTSMSKLTARSVVGMIGLGGIGSITTLMYMFALSRLPVAVALTMLFQFVWIGIVLQVVLERRSPNIPEIIAAILVVTGTLFTTGILHTDMSSVDPLGLLAGFASAVSYAFYLHFSAREGQGIPWPQRGVFVCLGTVIVTFVFCPGFFASEVVRATWASDILPLALVAQVIPVALLGVATPYLTTGMSTIMASSELPSGVMFSALLLSEHPDMIQIVGVVLVLAGIAVAQIPTPSPDDRA